MDFRLKKSARKQTRRSIATNVEHDSTEHETSTTMMQLFRKASANKNHITNDRRSFSNFLGKKPILVNKRRAKMRNDAYFLLL